MLRAYAVFFSALRSIIDLLVIGFAWVGVYYIRFYSVFEVTKGIPSYKSHLMKAVPIMCICYLSCALSGLYKPKRIQDMFRQMIDIVKASFFSGLLILAYFYYLQDSPYSRKLLTMFIAVLFMGLFFSHIFTVTVLRRLRRKGYNLRYYAVIGAGKKGQRLVQDIEQTGWLGLKCVFFVDNKADFIGGEYMGIPIYGPIEKLGELVKSKRVDEVYLALGGSEAQAAYPYLEDLQSNGITVRIIPDWGHLMTVSKATVVTIGSQILFSAADSPLSGINILIKEVFDRLIAFILLIILSVPLIVIALLVKLTSKGPVFYRQTRVGMNQREFKIFKFRTMVADAESENGPQWAGPDDPRRTKIGRFLRSTSLDELPQLINVLKGEMSLIGPRPERPCFVKEFSEDYKKYMLRHKVKAGMTGWAQINGFRGDTSLKKRLQYDLYYIRNWSFWLDMRILLLTPWQIIRGKNAY